MRIIPAIDLIDGKCVRLTKGDYAQKKIYNEDPLEVAKGFEGAGIQYLHLVDLDGARAKHIVNWRVLEKIAGKTSLKIDFGGGLKSDEDLRIAFESGASQVTGGSIAAKDEAMFLYWLEQHGPEKIILGADAKAGKIAVSGWEEVTELDVFTFIQAFRQKGIQYVICTDIDKDGMLEGPAMGLYRDILSENEDLKLIASGGVTSLDEIHQLREIGCDGAIIGKAIYEGRISLLDLEKIC